MTAPGPDPDWGDQRVAGVPVLLDRLAGWPCPHQLPHWKRLSTALRQRDIPAEVVIKTLAYVTGRNGG